MKKIAILGSTGSIGTQTLEIVRDNSDLQVVALAAGSNVELKGYAGYYCTGHGWTDSDRRDGRI